MLTDLHERNGSVADPKTHATPHICYLALNSDGSIIICYAHIYIYIW